MFRPNKTDMTTKRVAEGALNSVVIAPSEFQRKIILLKNVKLFENKTSRINPKFGNHTENIKTRVAKIRANSVYFGEHNISRYKDSHAVRIFCNPFSIFCFLT